MTSFIAAPTRPELADAVFLDFRLLGPIEVIAQGRSLNLGGMKQRAVLAMLVLHAPAVVSADLLIEEVWAGSPPDTAQAVLRTYVSHLRRALGTGADGGEALLETRRPGYALAVGAEQIDLRRFEALVRNGRAALARGDPAEARSRVKQPSACGAGSPWRIWPTNRSLVPRSPGWMGCASTPSRTTWRRPCCSGSTPTSWDRCNGWSRTTPCASGCGRS